MSKYNWLFLSIIFYSRPENVQGNMTWVLDRGQKQQHVPEVN